jgi:hypothetical protein
VKKELDTDGVKRRVIFNDEQEEEFLKSGSDAEDMGDPIATAASFAHVPHWPGVIISVTQAHIIKKGLQRGLYSRGGRGKT